MELLPATCVFSNLRTELSSDEWHLLEDKLCKGENKVCAACGYRDYKKSLRLFVDWTYEDENHIQRLRSLIPLCQTCYDVRRISNFDDISNNLIEHLAKLNDFSLEKAEAYLEACIAKKKERSKHPWKPDVSYLKRHFGIKLQTYDIKVLDQHLKTRVKPSIFTSIWKFIVQQCWNAMSVKQVFFIAGSLIIIGLLGLTYPVITKQLFSHHMQHKPNCQPYSKMAYINGRKVKVAGIACLASDGKWYIRS